MGTTYQIGTIIPLFFLRIRGNNLVAGLSPTVRILNASDGSTLLGETPLTEQTPGIYSYSWPANVGAFTQCIEIYRVDSEEFANQFTIDTGPKIFNIVQIETDVFTTPDVEAEVSLTPEAVAVVTSITTVLSNGQTEITDIQGSASNTVEASTTLEPTVDGVAELEC